MAQTGFCDRRVAYAIKACRTLMNGSKNRGHVGSVGTESAIIAPAAGKLWHEVAIKRGSAGEDLLPGKPSKPESAWRNLASHRAQDTVNVHGLGEIFQVVAAESLHTIALP